MISPSNFTCKEALELLDDFRRNDIEPHLRVMLTEHLASCDECAAELRMREGIAAHLRSALPASAAPTTLSPAVRREISRVRPAGTERRNTQLLPLMLTAAAIITIGVAMLQMHSTPDLQRSRVIASAPLDKQVAPTEGGANKTFLYEQVQEQSAKVPALRSADLSKEAAPVAGPSETRRELKFSRQPSDAALIKTEATNAAPSPAQASPAPSAGMAAPQAASSAPAPAAAAIMSVKPAAPALVQPGKFAHDARAETTAGISGNDTTTTATARTTSPVVTTGTLTTGTAEPAPASP